MSPSVCFADSGFVITTCLSEGVTASVYKANRVQDGLPVVLKVLDAPCSSSSSEHVHNVTDTNGNSFMPRELLILQKLEHISGCVRVLDFVENSVSQKWTIVFEDLESNGFINLANEVSKAGFQISELTVAWIMRELIKVVSEVHSAGILHCDLKLDNVFVDFKHEAVKLIDFNLSTYISESHAEPLSGFTAEYAPPEVLIQRKTWSVSGEVWSLGCIAFVLLCRRFPFKNPLMAAFSSPAYPPCSAESGSQCFSLRPSSKLFHSYSFPSFNLPQHSMNGSPDKLTLSHKAKDFLVSCLCREADQRPSLTKLLEHPFLRSRTV
ncbi:unnamed protein product [Dicrocoelium dendriticum]|nr:unnamed protein product [Dicrocoelium dendriticum]